MLHPEYGLGRIVAVEGAGPNRKGRVAFAVGPGTDVRPGQGPAPSRGSRQPGRATPPASAAAIPEHSTIMPSHAGERCIHVAAGCQHRSCRHAPAGPGRAEPDPVWAAVLAELGGADGITIHLREDRRHIQDRDLRLLRETVQVRLNLEMAVDPDMVAIALEVRPDQVTFVPERREELTTEGGLDVAGQRRSGGRGREAIAATRASRTALFIDPDPRQVEAAIGLGVAAVELHTGRYADAPEGPAEGPGARRAAQAAAAATSPPDWSCTPGMASITAMSAAVARLDRMAELNIGHSIVSRAVFVGLTQAVREMKECINRALLGTVAADGQCSEGPRPDGASPLTLSMVANVIAPILRTAS